MRGTGFVIAALPYNQRKLAIVTGLAVLRFQYGRRNTRLARWLVAGIALLCLFTQHLPWQSAFALEKATSRHPDVSNAISISFDPSRGPFQRISGVALDAVRERAALRETGMTSLSLPFHFSGVPTDTILRVERSEVQAIHEGESNARLYNGTDLEIHREGPVENGERVWQRLFVPSSTYNGLKDRPVRLELEYSLTLLTLSTSHALRATDGNQRIAGVGWCVTKVDDAEADIDLSCLQVGNGPSCGTAFLEYAPSGQRNPAVSSCRPDYAPFFQGSLFNGSLTRFGTSLPFRDPGGLTHYPVDGPKLAESQVVLRIYRPVAFFTRRLVIPHIRLQDWQTQ